jgi:hypothetical protein
LGLRQGAVGSRFAGGDMEERAEIGVGTMLALIAIEPSNKSPLFAWAVAKDTPALGSMTRAMIFQSTIPMTLMVKAVLAVV